MSVLQSGIIIWIATVTTIYIGARIGLAVGKGKELKLPSPIKAIEEHKMELERKAEREVFETNMENIDIYDGTGLGQKDFR